MSYYIRVRTKRFFRPDVETSAEPVFPNLQLVQIVDCMFWVAEVGTFSETLIAVARGHVECVARESDL